MKRIATALILLFFIGFGCDLSSQQQTDNPDQALIWKDVSPDFITRQSLNSEIQTKMERVQNFLKQENLDGMLLTQVRNFYWITAGQANNQIVLNKDVGAASILIMKDGSKYLIANGSEAPRLMTEVLGDLGYKLLQYNWYEANPQKDVRAEVLQSVTKNGKIGSDAAFPGTVNVADQFEKLRYRFTEPEMERYRWLGKQTTEAVENVCRRLRPGMDEYEIEAMTAAELRSRGIMPTVLLIAVDNRIYDYRHGLPAGQKLKKYGMVNVVAEKWGMPMAVTRFVHFGELPDELKNKIEKTAWVNAKFQQATVPGTPAAKIFESCKDWYREAGFPGEWKKHHQGGAIGYDDREYVIYPGIDETVQENQPFAWNPTITGAKVEDTMIAHQDGMEVVTHTGNWPMIDIELDGKTYPQPGILIAEEQNPDDQ
ncbi:MAG: M24 family metallopeptidase [Calditrichia bacterium]